MTLIEQLDEALDDPRFADEWDHATVRVRVGAAPLANRKDGQSEAAVNPYYVLGLPTLNGDHQSGGWFAVTLKRASGPADRRAALEQLDRAGASGEVRLERVRRAQLHPQPAPSRPRDLPVGSPEGRVVYGDSGPFSW